MDAVTTACSPVDLAGRGGLPPACGKGLHHKWSLNFIANISSCRPEILWRYARTRRVHRDRRRIIPSDLDNVVQSQACRKYRHGHMRCITPPRAAFHQHGADEQFGEVIAVIASNTSPLRILARSRGGNTPAGSVTEDRACASLSLPVTNGKAAESQRLGFEVRASKPVRHRSGSLLRD